MTQPNPAALVRRQLREIRSLLQDQDPTQLDQFERLLKLEATLQRKLDRLTGATSPTHRQTARRPSPTTTDLDELERELNISPPGYLSPLAADIERLFRERQAAGFQDGMQILNSFQAERRA
jgi:hypothetical protein